jgi:hypothetical protein
MTACLPISENAVDPASGLVARRRRALAAWEAMAADAGVAGDGNPGPPAGLLRDERRHVARLARELPAIRRDALAAGLGAGELEGAASAVPWAAPSGPDTLGAAVDLLAGTLIDERRLQAFCERLAAEAPDADLRLRALSLALAVSRHLQGLQAELARLRAKL